MDHPFIKDLINCNSNQFEYCKSIIQMLNLCGISIDDIKEKKLAIATDYLESMQLVDLPTVTLDIKFITDNFLLPESENFIGTGINTRQLYLELDLNTQIQTPASQCTKSHTDFEKSTDHTHCNGKLLQQRGLRKIIDEFIWDGLEIIDINVLLGLIEADERVDFKVMVNLEICGFEPTDYYRFWIVTLDETIKVYCYTKEWVQCKSLRDIYSCYSYESSKFR